MSPALGGDSFILLEGRDLLLVFFDLVPQFGGFLTFDGGLDLCGDLFYFFFEVGDPFFPFCLQVGDLLVYFRKNGRLPRLQLGDQFGSDIFGEATGIKHE
jgi:hypothetical protein